MQTNYNYWLKLQVFQLETGKTIYYVINTASDSIFQRSVYGESTNHQNSIYLMSFI